MCNLYSMTTNQKAIRDLFKVGRDTSGNLPPMPAIFPDQMAPVVRVCKSERELTMMRWGMRLGKKIFPARFTERS
jgi:putative SOS response-associated peptidase YedK